MMRPEILPKNAHIVARLRCHALRIVHDRASMTNGYGVITEKADWEDLVEVLDSAADEIEGVTQ